MDSAWEVNQGTNKTYVAYYAYIGRYLDDTLYGIDSCMIKYNISEAGVDYNFIIPFVVYGGKF